MERQTDKFVIPELVVPKKLLQFFGCTASSGIHWNESSGFPMKHRYQMLKEHLDDASPGMTNLTVVTP